MLLLKGTYDSGIIIKRVLPVESDSHLSTLRGVFRKKRPVATCWGRGVSSSSNLKERNENAPRKECHRGTCYRQCGCRDYRDVRLSNQNFRRI